MSLPPRDDWSRQWLIAVGLLVAAFAGWKGYELSRAPGRAPAPPKGGRAQWYLAVRMPPITTNYESGVDTMRHRYASWLDALRRAGFTPVRLSDAKKRLESGEGLPPRALVAIFEPGFRRTEGIVEEIFKRKGWPAVWMTDASAMRSGHREYVTHHKARQMAQSGWWDVGYSKAGGAYEIRSRSGAFTLGGPGQRAWADIEGTFALNRGAPSAGLNILNVNPDWTAEELVDRLRSELPIEGSTCLEKASIHHREWGVTGRAAEGAFDCPAFTLEAPLAKRGARLYWLGTSGAASFRLGVDAKDLVGELQLHLRSDETADREVVVVFNERKIVIDERRGLEKKRLGVLGKVRAGASAVITLQDERLTIQQSLGEPWVSAKLETPPAGVLQVSVFEKIRGVAKAEGLRLSFEPLPPTPVADNAR